MIAAMLRRSDERLTKAPDRRRMGLWGEEFSASKGLLRAGAEEGGAHAHLSAAFGDRGC